LKAEYDSEADIIAITLKDAERVDFSVPVHPNAVVGIRPDTPVEIQLLYPTQNVREPLNAAAARFGLDAEALEAAARSAIAAPDRAVTVQVAG